MNGSAVHQCASVGEHDFKCTLQAQFGRCPTMRCPYRKRATGSPGRHFPFSSDRLAASLKTGRATQFDFKSKSKADVLRETERRHMDRSAHSHHGSALPTRLHGPAPSMLNNVRCSMLNESAPFPMSRILIHPRFNPHPSTFNLGIRPSHSEHTFPRYSTIIMRK